jgi:uncharacterized membrane protein YpjA
MNSIFRFLNRIESLSTAVRLAFLLTVPAALLATKGRAPLFFALLMLTNLLGVIFGVILFRFRFKKQPATLLSFTQSVPLRGRQQLRRVA